MRSLTRGLVRVVARWFGQHRSGVRAGLGTAFSLLALTGAGIVVPAQSASASGPGFNSAGDVLIADQFNNRVIEVT